jgi:hypothetical protein
MKFHVFSNLEKDELFWEERGQKKKFSLQAPKKEREKKILGPERAKLGFNVFVNLTSVVKF